GLLVRRFRERPSAAGFTTRGARNRLGDGAAAGAAARAPRPARAAPPGARTAPQVAAAMAALSAPSAAVAAVPVAVEPLHVDALRAELMSIRNLLGD
ncbi:MAG: MerR family transcriptional regulator, partial [Pseudomonadota bacterium]